MILRPKFSDSMSFFPQKSFLKFSEKNELHLLSFGVIYGFCYWF